MAKQQFNDACKIAEILGGKFKTKIQDVAIHYIINQYKELFDSKGNQDLKSIEKSFVWFTKNLFEFKQKHLDLFPQYWGVICFLINEFCCEASIHVMNVL